MTHVFSISNGSDAGGQHKSPDKNGKRALDEIPGNPHTDRTRPSRWRPAPDSQRWRNRKNHKIDCPQEQIGNRFTESRTNQASGHEFTHAAAVGTTKVLTCTFPADTVSQLKGLPAQEILDLLHDDIAAHI